MATFQRAELPVLPCAVGLSLCGHISLTQLNSSVNAGLGCHLNGPRFSLTRVLRTALLSCIKILWVQKVEWEAVWWRLTHGRMQIQANDVMNMPMSTLHHRATSSDFSSWLNSPLKICSSLTSVFNYVFNFLHIWPYTVQCMLKHTHYILYYKISTK